MNLGAAIEAFNASSQSPIELVNTRDGRVETTLPRVGREIIVEGSPINTEVKVTAADIALLCEEARLSITPGMALLEAALEALNNLKRE